MRKILLFTFSWFTSCLILAQSSADLGWKSDFSKRKVFVENVGQFDQYENLWTGKILYGFDQGSMKILFGESGVCYSFLEATKKSKAERDELLSRPAKSFKEHKQMEKVIGKFYYRADEVNMTWDKPSKNATIVGINEQLDYHSYSVRDRNGEMKNYNYIKGFEKITYVNIFPNIDLEFIAHPEIGVKYAYTLHPGANVNDIISSFDRDVYVEDGEIHVPTLFGDIIDHAPVTFYQNDEYSIVESNFVLGKKGIGVELGKRDESKAIVIDPWIQTPNFALNWDCVWECDHDGAGNVYIIGGIDNMQLLKYNSTGVLQWTHNTPYDTVNGDWLGALITDDVGTSYVTQGVDARMQRIDALGNVVFSNGTPSGPGMSLSTEFWTMAFNCDQTKLTVGGSGGALNIHGRIYDMNMTTGNVNSTARVTADQGFNIPPNFQEIRGMCAAPNGRYYFITLDTIGYISDNLTLCPNNGPLYKTNSGFSWGYYTENWRTGNSGMSVIRVDSNYVYTHRGDLLQRRDLTTLAVISSVAIPNGIFQFQAFNGNQNHNAGIDIDQCGNIYVGSTNGVYKFNSSLVQTGFYSTSFIVYDVQVNTNGEIIAVGGTGDEGSASRTGGVQTFSASACNILTYNCCDASICIPSSLCSTDSPITLTPASTGGTWSGGSYINSSGVFDPAIAGPGVHSVTYTLPCGSETISIAVSACTGLSICIDSLGNLWASGGLGTYTWEEWNPGSSTPITNQTECQSCGYTWFFGQCLNGATPVTTCTTPAGWMQYATGTSASQPANFPLMVTDSIGQTIQIDSIQQIAPCAGNPCAGVTVTMNITTQSNPSCFGDMNGSATVAGTGGTGPYGYQWNPGSLTGATQTGLGAGTYNITVTDANGCVGNGTVTLANPSPLIASATTTDASCGVNDGTASGSATGGLPGYSYSWSPAGGTVQNPTGLAPGTYTLTVTDQNGCTDDTTVTISTVNGPTASLVSSTNVSCFGASDGTATVSATGGSPNYTYSWSPGSLTGASQSGLAADTYTVTVTDQNGCTDILTVIITEPTQIIIDTLSVTPANCGVNDGSVTVTASGGTGTLSYAWSPSGGTSATASNIGGGIYNVTVTDQNGCSDSLTIVVPTLGGPTLSINSSTDVSCFGQSDGSATIDATGGTPPYTYQWTPSGGTSSSASGLAAGNYSVTVTDNGGCVSVINITIGSPSEIIISETIVDEDCGQSNGSISLNVNGGSGNYSYAWTPGGETTNNLSNLGAGSYGVTVTDDSGCSVTANYSINMIGGLNVVATPNVATINSGESVTIVATGASSYVWTPTTGLDCSTCSNPLASPLTTTTYIVVGTDQFGCTGSDTVTIYVTEACGNLYVPTIFSPNGVGPEANNKLCVYGGCIAELSYTVYNRWGEVVFETTDQSVCWDGNYKNKPAITGVYAYRLNAVLTNGEVIEESGNVTLVR